MAHNLAQDSQGRYSFVSYKLAGWHTLGNVVNVPLVQANCIELAGHNFTADAVGLYRADMTPVSTHKAIIRSDDKRQLGIVGTGYHTLQNEKLYEFFRNVAGSSELILETAGALGDGETVWLLVRIPSLELNKGEDRSQAYYLITNTHNGSACVNITPTMIRVVCENTLRMAMGRQTGKRGTLSGGFKVRHTSGMESALADIARAYAGARVDFDATREAFEALTSAQLTVAKLDAILSAAFVKSQADADDKGDESARAQSIAKARRERILAILASPTCNVRGTAGTLWAGLNAVTQYVDHESRTRITDGGQTDAAQRFASSQFGGAGDVAKGKAFAAALALV
jgi:phage/plasmid-like protein (TIGR03299 family)